LILTTFTNLVTQIYITRKSTNRNALETSAVREKMNWSYPEHNETE
jgi:hypothetical protein